MKTYTPRQRCPDCRQRTEHVVTLGRLEGHGQDASQLVEYRCQICGRIEKTRRYPNLLANFFSVPTGKQEVYREA